MSRQRTERSGLGREPVGTDGWRRKKGLSVWARKTSLTWTVRREFKFGDGQRNTRRAVGQGISHASLFFVTLLHSSGKHSLRLQQTRHDAGIKGQIASVRRWGVRKSALDSRVNLQQINRVFHGGSAASGHVGSAVNFRSRSMEHNEGRYRIGVVHLQHIEPDNFF